MRPESIPFADCEECTLQSSIYVPSEINENHILVLVEAPGETEAKIGRPLVGDAGALLTKIMNELGMQRHWASYINSCCCRPIEMVKGRLNNRQPTALEIQCCNKRLWHEIEEINPISIVSMGVTSYVALGGKASSGFRINNIADTQVRLQNKYEVFYTYHPAAALYAGVDTEVGKRIRTSIKNAMDLAWKQKRKDIQLALF